MCINTRIPNLDRNHQKQNKIENINKNRKNKNSENLNECKKNIKPYYTVNLKLYI